MRCLVFLVKGPRINWANAITSRRVFHTPAPDMVEQDSASVFLSVNDEVRLDGRARDTEGMRPPFNPFVTRSRIATFLARNPRVQTCGFDCNLREHNSEWFYRVLACGALHYAILADNLAFAPTIVRRNPCGPSDMSLAAAYK